MLVEMVGEYRLNDLRKTIRTNEIAGEDKSLEGLGRANRDQKSMEDIISCVVLLFLACICWLVFVMCCMSCVSVDIPLRSVV